MTVASFAFDAISNVKLFNQMSDKCQAIYIMSNQYFGNHLSALGPYAAETLQRVFSPNPIRHLFNCLFKMHHNVISEADHMIGKLRASGPYLALHIRGYFSQGVYMYYNSQLMTQLVSVAQSYLFSCILTGRKMSSAFECANAMLEKGLVSRVFLATDMQSIADKARGLIADKKYLVMMDKDLEVAWKDHARVNRFGGHTQGTHACIIRPA